MNSTKLFLFIVMFITGATLSVSAQNHRSIKLGISYGAVDEQSANHAGMSINTGLEFANKSERIKFSPTVSLGYHNGTIQNFPYEPLDPLRAWIVQVETPINFELIRNSANTFSWILGIGAYGNLGLSSYLLGSIGGYTGTGFRISPADIPFSMEVLPINFMIGYGPYTNIFGRISIVFEMDSFKAKKIKNYGT